MEPIIILPIILVIAVAIFIIKNKKDEPEEEPVPEPIADPEPTFFEDFTQGLDRWQISSWQAPGNNGTHQGTFEADRVSIVDNYCVLRLDQVETSTGQFESFGGELKTLESFGYGVYKMRVRAASDSDDPHESGNSVSGTVTGIFNWFNGSETEIDIEFEGDKPAITHLTTWVGADNENEHSPLTLGGRAGFEQFYEYKIVWEPGKVTYYRNDELIGTHTEVVPSQEAPFFFNLWGTNDQWWGGYADTTRTRYMYVDWFSYAPQ